MAAEERMEDLPPHDRRRFFTAGLERLLRPLAGLIESRLPAELLLEAHLRPPGAIAEKEFLETCYRCGSCVEACPVDAIEPIRGKDEELDRTPIIHPERQPCTMCDALACMRACPSKALKLITKFDFRIGLAVVDHRLCVRAKGEDCRLCLDRCPLGEAAIRLDAAGAVRVIDPARTGRGCTGCGLCQQACPTRPKRAIQVRPQ